MAIILDKDGDVVTYENQPEQTRDMFPNLCDCQDLAAQIEILNNDIADLKEEIVNKTDYIYDTAQGAVATFSDGADNAPIKSLIANIEPAQDLHGYDAPWPAGGGKNKYNTETKTVGKRLNTTTGLLSDNSNWETSDFIPVSNEEITLTWDSQTDFYQASICAYDASKNYIADSGTDYSGYVYSHTFTVPNGTAFVRFSWSFVVSSTEYPRTNVRVSIGATDLGYAPYSNICPITGWTGAEVTRTSVNVWDEEWESGGIDSNKGLNTSSDLQIRSKNYIPVKTGIQLYIKSPNQSASVAGNLQGRYYDSDKQYLGYNPVMQVGNVITIPENCYYIRFACQIYYGKTYNNDISINYPATDTTYHSGKDNATYSVTFPTDAGTVYGGSLDVTTGVLTVDRAMVDLGTFTWAVNGSGNNMFFQTNEFNVKSSTTNAICSQYRYSAIATTNAAQGFNINGKRCRLRDALYIDSTAEEFKTAMSGVQLVYELALPQTYQLTPIEVRTLLGVNNILANTGNVSVIYTCDLKLYIDKKIAELQP